jgi:hypothetical protein
MRDNAETGHRLTRRTALGAASAAGMMVATGRLKANAPVDGNGATAMGIRVPLDHAQPEGGHFTLRYGLLSPFDARRRTVFVVADGQQFYVTPEAFAPSVGPIFGDGLNVVGVFGRADAPEVQAHVGAGAAVNWTEAYRLLKAGQWVADLDAVRRALLGPEGRIGLYGRSGGAFLVHQYMARHGRFVDHVFTQAAVNPFLEARFRLSSDHFWAELTADDRTRLSRLLTNGRYPRGRIANLFQRQNFFVGRDKLPIERTALINDLVNGEAGKISAREAEYQIDALAKMDETPRGAAAHVRLFEFFAPVAALFQQDPGQLHPDVEVSADFAEPLMKLLRAGTISMPVMDFSALHALRAQVFMIAGRWDHTCDYRTQIALAASYPVSELILLDDDHVLHGLQESGQAAPLVRAVFEGFGSPAYAAALKNIEALRWKETTA